ncbi:MAG: DinB family protein [Promethearchaeota archaeon]
MDKSQVLQFFKIDHQKLVDVLARLTSDQMVDSSILSTWTVKDIIAHISAWNWEVIKQVKEVLSDKKPWYADMTMEEFNEKEVKKRQNWPLKRILNEWKDSHDELIKCIENLTNSEWEYQSNHSWPEGERITVKSLFGYRYKGEGHEGGHAIQIIAYFNLE